MKINASLKALQSGNASENLIASRKREAERMEAVTAVLAAQYEKAIARPESRSSVVKLAGMANFQFLNALARVQRIAGQATKAARILNKHRFNIRNKSNNNLESRISSSRIWD